MKLFPMFLVAMMGFDSWREREAASAAMAKLGGVADYRVALASDDPEVRARGQRLIDSWYDLPTPWLDMLPEDWPGRSEIIAKYVRPGGSWEGWPEYRVATHDYCVELLKTKTRNEVLSLLQEMQRREAKWVSERSPQP